MAVDQRLGLSLRFETADIGFRALEKEGTTLPQRVVERVKAADGTILGPVSHNVYPPVLEGVLKPIG